MENGKEPVWDGMEMKILTPLTGDFFPVEEPEWEDESEWEYESDGGMEELDGGDLMQYAELIREAVDRENSLGQEGGGPCNLMDYFHGSASVKEKVESAVISVESADGVLYGCTTLRLKEVLESQELNELCKYITGQYGDGWGEGFEQRDIKVDGGTLNVHFWQENGMKYRIQETEEKKPDRGEEKTAGSGSHAKKIRPKLRLTGHDGNIFSIMGDAKRLLARNGQGWEADEMCKRGFQAGSYNEALGIISEYVETELSSAREKKGQKKQKPGRSPCR